MASILPVTFDKPEKDFCATISVVEEFDGYALLDTGNGRKLERFGNVIVDRPEAQAIWMPGYDNDAWKAAHGIFAGDDDAEQGKWRLERDTPAAWPANILNIRALCRLSAFRHLGVFPEQLAHWQWMAQRLQAQGAEKPRLLNLFGYTGVASLIAAASGAEVTHVDASKKSVEWARENQALSGLDQAPIRWIVDDARKFAAREVRRGRIYHGILVDPPKFGRGPEGEVWDLFADLPDLLRTCRALLAPGSSFIILTTYAIRASFLSIDTLMREVLGDAAGTLESGELALREKSRGRLLSTSLYSRWQGGP